MSLRSRKFPAQRLHSLLVESSRSAAPASRLAVSPARSLSIPTSLLLARWVRSSCGRFYLPRTTTDPPPHPRFIGRQRACPRCRPGQATAREKPGWFPRSPCTFRWGRCPAFPLQPCHEYAAGLPRGLRVGDIIPARSRLAYLIRSARAADRPTSTRFEPAKALEGVQPLVHTCYAFPSCSPDPRRLAVPAVRLCRGCLLPEPALPGSGLSQLHRPAATG